MLDVPDTERLQLRISPELIAAIDRWRLSLPEKPPRATAIKRLIGMSLDAEAQRKRTKQGPKK
jgi:hypothetical protein